MDFVTRFSLFPAPEYLGEADPLLDGATSDGSDISDYDEEGEEDDDDDDDDDIESAFAKKKKEKKGKEKKLLKRSSSSDDEEAAFNDREDEPLARGHEL